MTFHPFTVVKCAHYSYRSYQPYDPVNSRLLKKRWDQYAYDKHRRKVLAAKTHINNSTLKVDRLVNMKKIQNEAYRSAEIDRHNKILLDKMDAVWTKGGRTDNRNNYTSKRSQEENALIYRFFRRELGTVEKSVIDILKVTVCSLNAEKRRRELVQIAHENREILKRLSEPNYDHKKLLLQWKENCERVRNISHFPPPGHPYRSRCHGRRPA